MRPLRTLATAAWVVWLASGPVLSQTTSGSLTGTVRTEGGAPVVDAVILAQSTRDGALRQAVSDGSGRYRLDQLEPGAWRVLARLTDGQASESQTILLHLQETIQLDFTVAGLIERVTVRAESPLVDRKETARGLRLTAEQADTLPLAGRQFSDLALLDSAARTAAPGNFYGERDAVFVVNGQSGRSNSFLVDGLDNNDQVSGTTLNSSFSQQVIDEFVLLTHQFAPEFGRATGGVLNIVTKQGSNQPSFGFFAQGTDERWNQTGSFVGGLPAGDVGRDAVGRYQGGFNLGGPLRRDRAFYFAAYEHQRADDVVPFTGVDRDGVEGGRFTAPSESDNLFSRMDFNLLSASSLMLRVSADERENSGVNVKGLITPEGGFRIEEHDLQLAAALKTIVSPTLIHEVRALVGSSNFEQHANSERPGVTHPSGIFGGNYVNRQERDERILQLVDNVTWRRGPHTLKFGADLLRSRTEIAVDFNRNGNFIYDTDAPFEPGDCGSLNPFLVELARQNGTYPLVPCAGLEGVDDDGDGAIDEPGNIESYPKVYSLIDGAPDETLEDTRIALFGQDHLELGRLVLDYGLRYELSTFELPASAAVDSTIENGGADRDTDNWAPRFGFTWEPRQDGKLVVRGGVGVFYDKLVLAFPAVSAVTSGTAIQLAFPQPFALEITEDFVEANGPEAAEPFVVPELTLRFSTGTELKTPYTVQYSLGLERELGRFGALRADLLRVRGHDLPVMLDLNPVTCVPDLAQPANSPDCIGLPTHPDPTTGSIVALVTEGQSWYDALDVSWRFVHEASWLQAGYTLSRAEDLGPDPLKDGVYVPPDSTDLGAERSRSDGDRRHRVVVSGDFPLRVLGLRGSAVAQFATGVPFNVTTGRDDDLNGILSDRPPGVERNSGEDTPLGPVNALRAELGLPPVDDLDEPEFYQVDLRIYRKFGLASHRASAEGFVQVFNLLNRENFGLIEGRVASRNFGEPISLAGPPRTIELGFRYAF